MSEENSSKDDFTSRWENLLSEADISTVPVNYLREVEVKMLDGTAKFFNIKKMLEEGYSTQDIEDAMEEFVEVHDDEIDTLDFHLNVEEIAKEISEKTKRLLG